MIAFQPKGPVQSFTAAGSAPTSITVVPMAGLQAAQVMLTNISSTIDVTVGWGASDTEAKANAVAGLAGCAKQYYLLRGTQVVVSAKGPYFTGISVSSTAVVEVQPGTGN